MFGVVGVGGGYSEFLKDFLCASCEFCSFQA